MNWRALQLWIWPPPRRPLGLAAYLPLVLWSAAGVGIHLTGFGVWVAHEPGTLDPAGVLAVFLGPGFMLGLLLVLLGALLVKGIGLRDEEDCAASTEDTPT